MNGYWRGGLQWNLGRLLMRRLACGEDAGMVDFRRGQPGGHDTGPGALVVAHCVNLKNVAGARARRMCKKNLHASNLEPAGVGVQGLGEPEKRGFR